MYSYVWLYVVKPECFEAFRIAYGPEGEWVQLFRRDPKYIRTNLLRDCQSPSRFMTIDYWTSREAFVSFRERFSAEFESLDKSCSQFTVQESHLGDFDVLDDDASPRH